MTHEGSHVIDYASLWNPAPWTRVRATAERTEPDLDGPNVWHATIDLAGGSALEVTAACERSARTGTAATRDPSGPAAAQSTP
ncbi:MAG: hypothetical protein ABIP48_25440 [Planctomycetota bacterium]